jgi:hypothetical protein
MEDDVGHQPVVRKLVLKREVRGPPARTASHVGADELDGPRLGRRVVIVKIGRRGAVEYATVEERLAAGRLVAVAAEELGESDRRQAELRGGPRRSGTTRSR